MADFNEMLTQVLSNPQAVSQIQALAQNLGLQNQSPAPPKQEHTPHGQDPMELMRGLLQLSRQSSGDEKQIALFQALKPFVRPERAAKLDKAIQVARISRLAGNALQTLGPQFFQAGENHV